MTNPMDEAGARVIDGLDVLLSYLNGPDPLVEWALAITANNAGLRSVDDDPAAACPQALLLAMATAQAAMLTLQELEARTNIATSDLLRAMKVKTQRMTELISLDYALEEIRRGN